MYLIKKVGFKEYVEYLIVEMLNLLCTDRVAKYIAEYYLELKGKVDAIVFTAGVGENGPMFREKVVEKLAPLGIKLDKEDNNNTAGYKDRKEGVISSKDSTIKVYVEPTNEEVMIVKDTYELVQE